MEARIDPNEQLHGGDANPRFGARAIEASKSFARRRFRLNQAGFGSTTHR